MSTFDGIVPMNSWGERSYFYNPGSRAARGIYFLTIKEKDGANDRASNLIGKAYGDSISDCPGPTSYACLGANRYGRERVRRSKVLGISPHSTC